MAVRIFQEPANRRLDPALYAQASRVTFITVRSAGHTTPFTFAPLNTAIIECLRAEQSRLWCRVFTYCLMPDHLHFLISPAVDGFSVLDFTDQFKGKSTNLSWAYGWQGKLWQKRYYDRVIRSARELRAVARYILENPVRQGLAKSVEDWPWSGQMNPLPL